jgi:adenine-specific DNA-methyltransferase
MNKTSNSSHEELNSINLNSSDILQQNIENLKKLFPQIVVDGKIDFDTLKLILDDELEDEKQSYKFQWAGKKQCYKAINSTTNATLKYSKDDSLNPKDNDNIIIEGDNLEVLKLLQKSYRHSIKMIYIDPPYNTGNDFVYEDDFNTPLEKYYEITGQKQKGEDTTSKKSKEGRRHALWLNMIYPRLILARNLLKDDGVIFISIDDNEVHNLKMICNEIFGEENFIANLIRQTRKGGGSMSKYISSDHDYILVYSKNINSLSKMYVPYNKNYLTRYKEEDNIGKYFWDTYARNRQGSSNIYTINAPDGTKLHKAWINPKSKFEDLLKRGEVRFKKIDDEKWSVQVKQRIGEYGQIFRSLLLEDTNEYGTKSIKNILGNNIFDYAKPIELMKKIINASTNKNDLILDFFAGSGTTGQAVLELNKEDGGNRKFILVQLPEPTNPKSEAYKNGYKYISDITKQRIRRVVRGYGKNPTPINSGFKVFKLDNSNYKLNEKINYLYSLDEKQKDNQKDKNSQTLKDKIKTSFDFEDKFINGWKKEDVIYENIIKEGYNLNSTIKELTNCKPYKIYKISDSVKEKSFYITFDEIDIDITLQDEFKDIANDTLFICLDSNLKDNVKLNLKYSFILKTL